MGLISVAVVAVLMSVVGAFYYLRIIKVMYFDKPVKAAHLLAPVNMRIMFGFNAITVLFLGIFPGSLFALCANVFS